MNLTIIQTESAKLVELRRRLLELHPQIDEQTLADTLAQPKASLAVRSQ